MTDDEIQSIYADSLIVQYRGKTKFRATVKATAAPMIRSQLPLAIQNAFDLESAIGVQLDVLGKYQGVTRYGRDFSGNVTLNDDDFRQYIKLAIILNHSNGSLASIQDLLGQFFPAVIYIFDYGNMRIGYFLDSDAVSSQLAEFFIMSGKLPKPMGVQLSSVIYLVSIDNFFGCADQDIPGYAWSGATSYPEGAVVRDGTTNDLYISLVDSNLNNALSDAAFWQELPFPVGGFCEDTDGLSGQCFTDGDFL